MAIHLTDPVLAAPVARRPGVVGRRGTDAAMPPPAPDRRIQAVLLVLLLTALLLTGPPLPPAHATESPGAVGAVGAVGTAGAVAVTAGLGPGPGRAWPVGGRSDLLRRFDAPPVRWAAGHRGVDLAASEGMTVRAAAPGVVSFTGMVAGRPVVTVTHPASGTPPLRTTYLPVIGSVPTGALVAAGDAIGTVSAGTGHCAAGCLHWGLLRGKRYLDPLALMGSGQARLLPLDGR
ncbi:M23 family metallopeptidase [Kitasatospora sp. GP82]|uniref:M23 family metallopeptidase n=1 Tax=Kitasatospora sp. GP82 TaxID=3035089 RepID=UPI002472E8C2|nr:M23 family metallopeptidase [Kitasatospora sp. GP82]MDH6129171.1 murein DD-endopeptidase MepM/ murein hydrolase activator NlpD [Kitasatospora sp. GP82]